MLLEQIYLIFIYILFGKLAMVTVVAFALVVALIATTRKLDNEKIHFCLILRDAFQIFKKMFIKYYKCGITFGFNNK